MSQQIKYTATVDTNPFAAGTQRIGQTLQELQSRTGGYGLQMGQVGAAIRGHMAAVTESVRSEVASMGGHFGSLLDALGATRVGFGALMVAAAGLAAAKVAQFAAQTTESTMDLARVMGSSTNEAQAWRVALDDVGATQADLEGAAKGLARQLKENEGRINELGLRTRDAAGNLRPMSELLVDGIDILNEHAEGADRALVSQELFGRGVDASSKLLLLNRGVISDATGTMQELGLEVGANAVTAWKEFDAASDRASAGMRGLGYTVGRIVMPVITDIIRLFNAAMPAAIVVARGAIGGLTTAFHLLQTGVVTAWETINATVITVGEAVRVVLEGIGRAMAGDFAGARAVLSSWWSTIGNAWSGAMDRMVDSAMQTRARIAAIWSDDTAPGEPEGDRGTRGYRGRPPPTARPPAASGAAAREMAAMPTYEATLAEQKRVQALLDGGREYTKSEELAFWREILATYDVTSKDRLAIVRKIADAEVQLMRDQAKQRQALENEQLKGWQDRALGAVDAAQQEARGLFDLGEITRLQLLDQERALEEQRNQIRLEYLQARLDMVDPERDPVLYEQISLQIEEAERLHQQRLRQIRIEGQAAALDNPIARTWQAAEQAMQQAGARILQGQQSLRQGLASIWQGIRAQIAGEISRIVAARAMAFARERLLSLAGIGTKAAEAGAGAAASQASIPIVGPGLALAAMATVVAAVMSLGGKVPSAARGWDIPRGLNPLTQLHEQEMVLPAEQANVIRTLAEGRGAAPEPVVLRTVGTMGDFLMVHRHDLAKVIAVVNKERLRS